MKRIQPFHYIAALAGLFVLTGLYFFVLQLLPEPEHAGITVEPQGQNQGGALYDLWFTSAKLYDLSVDHNLTGIILANDENKVSLLDRDRKLRWDKSFSTAPKQAKISSCGNYVVTGTEGGLISFVSTDQEFSWEDEGLPVDHIAVSPNGNWVVAARSKLDEEEYHIDFFNRDGELKWTIERSLVENLFFAGEHLDQANILYTHHEDEQPVFSALDLDGNELWAYPGQSLVAVSRHGSRMAAVGNKNLIVYDSQGKALWETDLSFEAKTVIFNPQNYNRLLVYGDQEGADENLFYYDLTDDLLWQKRVADGSLFSFTADGQHIVSSSWRHYREDYTRMKILNRHGDKINSWEVAMRVEKLIKSGHPLLIVVGGDDGYIDIINLETLLIENDKEVSTVPIYNPVSTEKRPNETNILLYFIDESTNLVPVTRTITKTDDPLQAALEELIRGPSRGSALYRTIPAKDVAIEVDFIEEKGRLNLDLSPELAELSGFTRRTSAIESIVLTVSSFAKVKEIIITVEGKMIEDFGEDLTLEQPLAPHRWNKPVYVPIMSGNRYYLSIREMSRDDQEADLQQLIEQSLRACRMLPFVPADLKMIDLRISQEQIQVNLNSTFKKILPDKVSSQNILQAELILDSLFMTIFENSPAQRVEFLIEGESWTAPAGYPSLSRFYHRPYYINPEQ